MSITIEFNASHFMPKQSLQRFLADHLATWKASIFDNLPRNLWVQTLDDLTPYEDYLNNWNEEFEAVLEKILPDMEKVDGEYLDALDNWFIKGCKMHSALKNPKLGKLEWQPLLEALQALFYQQLQASYRLLEYLHEVLSNKPKYADHEINLSMNAVDLSDYHELVNTIQTSEQTGMGTYLVVIFAILAVIAFVIWLVNTEAFKGIVVIAAIISLGYLLIAFVKKFPIFAAILVILGISS